ncbi:MAG: Gfo/Idh/MocA family oxidoreductase [Phycisphaerae bacterium]|nr:Gfo/Idh/MocA family oxidoreductase [Phycisphaerae bacterium]
MANSKQPSRRAFLGHAAGVGAASFAAPYIMTGSALAAGANEKINVGFIGVNGQGRYSLGEILKQPDTVVTAICDVSRPRRDDAVAAVRKVAGKGDPKPYTDFREVLARKDIDAVVMAPPPHWHCLMGIMAAEAGKDFYLEKPMTLHPGETRALATAVKKHQRITQMGTQIHAVDNYRRVVEYVQSGKLGKISTVRTFNIQNQGPDGIGNAPNTDPPPDVDWDMWIGPAKYQKFNPTLFTGSFHHCSWMAYSGGWTPGMAPHIVDLPVWALELGCPSSVSATGGRFLIKDAGDAYDNHEVLWSYPKFTMTWMSSMVNSYGWDFGHGTRGRRLGIYFHGVNGTMFANYGMHKIVPEGDYLKTIDKAGKDTEPPPQSIPKSKGHHREWLDGIRTRTQPLCHVGYHANIDIALTTSLLAMKLQRTIHLDPSTMKIVGDPEAEKLSIPTYRDPWKFPAQYL